jgi:NADH-quinone oxidoreductase subunit F
MSAYSEIRARAEAVWQGYERPGRTRIDVTVATCAHAAGVSATLEALRGEIAAGGLDADLGILSCGGMCFLEPLVVVTHPDGRRVLYGPVTADTVGALLERTVKARGVYTDLAVGVVAGEADGVPALSEHPFMKLQTRWLMQNVGVTDPENLDHYIARGGFEGLSKAVEMESEAVIQQMVDSGVWGRGGAGFPAGRKWDFLRGARNEPKYLICNADEGDPGAFVNRILLEGDPGLVIEGMLIAGAATGARYGFIYIRDEYPLAVERVEKALAQARERGLAGDHILGSNVSCNLRVIRGAGAYVCGDETGLLSSIQDSRGMPRIKPPFPANAGVFGLPSNVNNVETYADAPLVFRNGVEWYKSVGTEKSPGTKMFSITGDVQRVGALEVPFGTLTRTLIEACGGPYPGGEVKIIQSGGPLAGMIPGRGIDTPLDLDPYREWKVLMGGGGIVICDESTCAVDLATYFEWFAEDESCGRCTTCHGGTQRYVEILRRISDGGGRMSDIELLELLADTLRWSNCFHGQGAPAAVTCLLLYFRDELVEHIQEKRCRAGVCRGLIRYEVNPAQAGDVAAGAAICPTNAIKQGEDGRYVIDQSLCIKCDACREVQPEAIRVVEAYTVTQAEPVAAD